MQRPPPRFSQAGSLAPHIPIAIEQAITIRLEADGSSKCLRAVGRHDECRRLVARRVDPGSNLLAGMPLDAVPRP